MPRSDQRWSERKVPARSTRTRTCRNAPLKPSMTIGRLANGLSGKWQSIKYRDVSVKHGNNLPVSPRSLTASCRPTSAPRPAASEQNCSAATLGLSPYKLTRSLGSLSELLWRADANFSCSKPARHECLAREIMTQQYRYPHCYESRPHI